MGKVELYIRLLRKFRDSQQAFRQDFFDSRADSDPSAAARLAHSLRGTAGNIGALELANAATALEQACLDDAGEPLLAERLAEVERCLAPVLQGLASLPEALPPADPVPASTANGDWQARLAGIRQLLVESDTQVLTALHELQGLTLEPELAEQLRRIVQRAERFDFDEALALLENLS